VVAGLHFLKPDLKIHILNYIGTGNQVKYYNKRNSDHKSRLGNRVLIYFAIGCIIEILVLNLVFKGHPEGYL
jgi:hypothetical protein